MKTRSHLQRWLVAALVLASAGAADAQRPAPTAPPVVVPVFADPAALTAGAQAIVDAVAAEVARVRGGTLAPTPAVEIRNTPQLIFFSRSANQIVVPWWGSVPLEMRQVFRTFSGGDDTAAEHFFRAFFNRFLVAHEAAHWFQDHAGRRESTLYENERMANRFAVAFWRTQPGGERLLEELERLAARAAANLPDPTPSGEDAAAYFGANYQMLGRDPLKYGYYQFRFMHEAIRDRANRDFATIAAAPPR